MTSAIIPCPSCGRKNRIPAIADGTPRCAVCKAALPWVAEATDAEWGSVVDDAPVPVVVDFWAAWCGPCRVVGPVLEQLAGEYAGRLKLVKVDVDRSPGLSQRFGIQGIPTLAVLSQGRVVSRQTGAAGADQLRRWIDGALAQSG